jgi:Skp family chaperone for outer membrane proteins
VLPNKALQRTALRAAAERPIDRWTDLRTLMRLLAVAFVLTLSGCASTRASMGDAVAFANLHVAVRECREGREARDELLQMFRGSQERLDRRQEDLVKERAGIAASRAQGEDVQARQEAFQSHLVTVHDEYTKLQKDLTEAELRRADQIRSRLRAILREEARARGIAGVSDSDIALNDGRRYVDLTAEVIRAADASATSRAPTTNTVRSQP